MAWAAKIPVSRAALVRSGWCAWVATHMRGDLALQLWRQL